MGLELRGVGAVRAAHRVAGGLRVVEHRVHVVVVWTRCCCVQAGRSRWDPRALTVHGDPGCGHRWLRQKSRAGYAAFGSLRTPLRCPPSQWNAVRLQRGTVSGMTVEYCPPSVWNAVRLHRGTVSAIPLEHCPPSAWNRVRHGVEYAPLGAINEV